MKKEICVEQKGCPNVDDKIIVRYDGKGVGGAKLEKPCFLDSRKCHVFPDGFAILTPAVIHGRVLCYVELYKTTPDDNFAEGATSGFLETGVFNNPTFSSFDECLVTLKKDGCSLRVTYTD